MEGISVIICCYNSEKIIERCLIHIFSQNNTTDIPWEIIVINNASVDSTVNKAKSCNEKYNTSNIPFKIIDENTPGLYYARIKGRDTAIYNYLLYVDDDNFLDEDYISKGFILMKNNNEVGITGGLGREILEEGVIYPKWFENHKITLAVGPQSNNFKTSSFVDYVYGAGFIIRKDYWLKLVEYGFDNILKGRTGKNLLSGEDVEICYAFRLAGYKIIFDPNLKFRHLISPNKINDNYLEKLYYGIGKSNLIISVYKHYLTNEYNPRENTRFPLWINRYFYLRKILRKIHKTNKNIQLYSPEWSKEIEIKGQISYLLKLRTKYDKIFDRIFLLNNKIKANNNS